LHPTAGLVAPGHRPARVAEASGQGGIHEPRGGAHGTGNEDRNARSRGQFATADERMFVLDC
jgi:hypothetical protein